MLKDHLKSRHLNFELHRPMLDEVNNVATFYLWNLSGQMTGFLQYRPDGTKDVNNDRDVGKYFHYTSKGCNSLSLFGVESLHLSPNVVFVVEGMFDATRLTEKGYSALALLCNDSNNNLRTFLKLLDRKVVAVCDNDKAGKKLAKFGNYSVVCEDHDLGDSSDEFVNELLRKYG
jgi:hypothetical protein